MSHLITTKITKYTKDSRKNNMIIFIRVASVNERNDRSVTVAALFF